MTIGGGMMPAADAAMGRRALLAGLFASPPLVAARADTLLARLGAIERGPGGRLGVSIWVSRSGWRDGWRADERFPLCSMFKLVLPAASCRVAIGGKNGWKPSCR